MLSAGRRAALAFIAAGVCSTVPEVSGEGVHKEKARVGGRGLLLIRRSAAGAVRGA